MLQQAGIYNPTYIWAKILFLHPIDSVLSRLCAPSVRGWGCEASPEKHLVNVSIRERRQHAIFRPQNASPWNVSIFQVVLQSLDGYSRGGLVNKLLADSSGVFQHSASRAQNGNINIRILHSSISGISLILGRTNRM